MVEDMDDDVMKDPHMTMRKVGGPEDNSEMQPLMAEMDKDIEMMTGSVRYMGEDMRNMKIAMFFVKENMRGMKPAREAMKDMGEVIQFVEDDLKNMMSNLA